MELFYLCNIVVVIAFAGLGLWLESINGKHGFVDECLTPFPLGLSGLAFVLMRWEFSW